MNFKEIPEYKGYKYSHDEERFEDNRKIIHMYTDPKTGELIQIDFSPYIVMDEGTFKRFVDLGFPKRLAGSVSPWNTETIKKEYDNRNK